MILKCAKTSKKSIFCEGMFILSIVRSLTLDHVGHWTKEIKAPCPWKCQQLGDNVSKNSKRILLQQRGIWEGRLNAYDLAQISFTYIQTLKYCSFWSTKILHFSNCNCMVNCMILILIDPFLPFPEYLFLWKYSWRRVCRNSKSRYESEWTGFQYTIKYLFFHKVQEWNYFQCEQPR